MSLIESIKSAFGMASPDQADPTVKAGTISINSSDPSAILGGDVSTSAGVPVTPVSAMRVAAVYACVRLLAGGLAMLPMHVYRASEDTRKRLYNNPLERLLNVEPTSRYSAAEHWEGVMADILLRGDAYTFIKRTHTGRALELIPLPHSAVSVKVDTSVWPNRLKYFVSDGMKAFGCDASDMLHFPGFGFDGTHGMSVIAFAARNATGNALAMDKYSGSFFGGGANPSIVLSSDKEMPEELIERMRKEFVARYSGTDNMHKNPLILTEGLKAEKLTISASDAQLIEARQFQVIDIARAFGVPPHMIGETSASTSWGTGIESMNRAFVTWSLNPHLIRIEQEINRKLMVGNDFVEINRQALMQGDSKTQAEYLQAMLGGPGSGPGIMSVNEVRRVMNLKPVKGFADEVYDPRNEQAVKQNEEV